MSYLSTVITGLTEKWINYTKTQSWPALWIYLPARILFYFPSISLYLIPFLFTLSGLVLRSEDPILSSQCCRLDGLLCCTLRSLTNRVGLLPKSQSLMSFRREAAQINRNMPDMSCFGHYTACNRRCSRLS